MNANLMSSPPNPSSRPPIHGNVQRKVAQTIRPNRLNQGDMATLESKIAQQQKSFKTLAMQGQQVNQNPPRVAQSSPRLRLSGQNAGGNACNSQQSIQRQQGFMATQGQGVLQRQQQQQQIQSQLITTSMEVDNSDQFMEVDPDEQTIEIGNQNSAMRSENEVNESYAYLQQEIKDPASTIVQHQINGNEAKMLVILPNGEQRLITFEVPKEDCTVLDLLEQVTKILTLLLRKFT